MAESYEAFLSFDWSDERWRSYLNGLYPPPNQAPKAFFEALESYKEQEQIAKFKKKWYKKPLGREKERERASERSLKIFKDDLRGTWIPASMTASKPRLRVRNRLRPLGRSILKETSAEELGPLPKGIYCDGTRWASLGAKASICLGAYSVSLAMLVGCWAGVFAAYQATVITAACHRRGPYKKCSGGGLPVGDRRKAGATEEMS